MISRLNDTASIIAVYALRTSFSMLQAGIIPASSMVPPSIQDSLPVVGFTFLGDVNSLGSGERFKDFYFILSSFPGLFTTQAMHTQDDTATVIVREKEADYVFTVKGNQPKLKEEIEKALNQSAFSP